MMNRYVETLKSIFDPVALFVRDEEFVVVIEDEAGIEEKIRRLQSELDDELSVMILSKDELARLSAEHLGERIL